MYQKKVREGEIGDKKVTFQMSLFADFCHLFRDLGEDFVALA